MQPYYKYWGKAAEDGRYHLLPYHCLDVAAVASAWWDEAVALRNLFAREYEVESKIIKAWVLFFISLHDLGKFDVRFQLKDRQTALSLNPLFSEADPSQAKGYDHGRYGTYWFFREQRLYGFNIFDDTDLYHWIWGVCGHHGRGFGIGNTYDPPADNSVIQHDHLSRIQWIKELRSLFLEPAGIISLNEVPSCPDLLAGFCSVCDWLGSNTAFFEFEDTPDISPYDYFNKRITNALSALRASGILSKPARQGGMDIVFHEYTPRGFQQIVDHLPLENGLMLIEAPTGSGKTEAAIAYASRLLAAGLADSVIFALPTQATANAMLGRLEKIGTKLFPENANVVLAHGKAQFNSEFIELKKSSIGKTVQGGEEAFAQCSEWLATSRKRVFLGQIGVCTVDQVLLSVLPVRHHFVRAFGIRKSILIIDEIHAYDSYMNGLLDMVLEAQNKAGGSAILLSATLPASRRAQIFEKWGSTAIETDSEIPYPLITHAGTKVRNFECPEPAEERTVKITVKRSADMYPVDELFNEVMEAAVKGALVVIICNLVKDAQKISRRLRQIMNEKAIHIDVDLFHSRFRFMDRQRIEKEVMERYGKGPLRSRGRILVSTQVVEQSLDLDFDWMVSQLCPVDLLFQRLGRLHRHKLARPSGISRVALFSRLPV